MKKKNNLFLWLINLILILNIFTVNVMGSTMPKITAESAIVVDRETGKVLYEKNADFKAYPASTTKLLTALVMVDHISMDEIIVIGDEVYEVPWDSSKAGHMEGESITGKNLLRALLIPSGNETGSIIAAKVVEKMEKNPNIPYEEAEVKFAELMNEKAKSLGATHSNFVNPHGYDTEFHYTSARDMSMIARAALDNKDIANTVMETKYIGNGGEGKVIDGLTQDYEWNTTNMLLKGQPYYYPYAKGMKTGYTNLAGYCLVSYAEKDDKQFVTVIFRDTEPERWDDTIRLFNYAFDTYDYRFVEKAGTNLDTIGLYDPQLGEDEEIDVLSSKDLSGLFSEEEFKKIDKEIIYSDRKLIYEEKEDEDGEIEEVFSLKLPIVKGDILGKVEYTLDGKVIFEEDILAAGDAEERTFKTDVDYYIKVFKENVFTLKALPGWIMIIAIIVLIISLIRTIIRRRRDKRNFYKINRRY